MKRNLGFETEFLVSTRVGVKYIKWYKSKVSTLEISEVQVQVLFLIVLKYKYDYFFLYLSTSMYKYTKMFSVISILIKNCINQNNLSLNVTLLNCYNE